MFSRRSELDIEPTSTGLSGLCSASSAGTQHHQCGLVMLSFSEKLHRHKMPVHVVLRRPQGQWTTWMAGSHILLSPQFIFHKVALIEPQTTHTLYAKQA